MWKYPNDCTPRILSVVITNINTAMKQKLGCHFQQGDRQSRFQPVPSFIVPCPRCLPRFTRPNMAQRDVKERHKRENLATSLVRTVALFNFSHATRRKRRWPASSVYPVLAVLTGVTRVLRLGDVMGTLRNAGRLWRVVRASMVLIAS